MIHELPLERRTLHGRFSCELEPVMSIDPGDSVRFATPNAAWYLESGERFPGCDPDLDQGHALAGPIEVRGAEAGGTLSVRVDEVRPGSWGFTFAAPSHEVRWELDGETGVAAGHTVRLAPSRSRAPSSRPATATPRRATGRSRGPRSNARCRRR